MSNQGVDALLSQPPHHQPAASQGVSLTLVRSTDYLRDLGGKPILVLADGGLDRAERLCILAPAHHQFSQRCEPSGDRPTTCRL